MYYDYEIYDAGSEQTPIYYREGNLEMVCMHFLRMFFSGSDKDWLYESKENDEDEQDMSSILKSENSSIDPKKIAKKHLNNIVRKI